MHGAKIANRAERIRTSDLLTPRLARTPEAVSEQEQRCHRSHRSHRCRKRSKHDPKEWAQSLDWARVDVWIIDSQLLASCKALARSVSLHLDSSVILTHLFHLADVDRWRKRSCMSDLSGAFRRKGILCPELVVPFS